MHAVTYSSAVLGPTDGAFRKVPAAHSLHIGLSPGNNLHVRYIT
jgi:hypothetical protein